MIGRCKAGEGSGSGYERLAELGGALKMVGFPSPKTRVSAAEPGQLQVELTRRRGMGTGTRQ